MPLNIQWDPGEDEQRRQDRAVALAQDLMNKGLQPEAINSVVNSYVKTGQLNLPSMQTKALPFDPEVPEGRTTRVPVNYVKKKGLFTLDQGSGQISQVNTPDDMTDYEVKTIPPQKPVNNNKGHTIKVDRATGQTEDQGENGKTYNDYVYWDSRANRPAGGGKESPDVAVAKKVIGTYVTKRANGDDLPDDFMDSARSAADRLGITLEEVEKDPGMLDALQTGLSNATGGAVPNPQKKLGSSGVRFKGGEGKVLTPDVVAKYMKLAGNDRKKAKALAQQAGYNW